MGVGDLRETTRGEAAVSVRRALPNDAPHIARVHAEGWRTSYTGMIPESAFAGRGYGDRLRQWCARLSSQSLDEHVFVAVAGDGVAGFVYGGPTGWPELPYDGELYAIYVLPEYHGKRIGSTLFRVLARTLGALGYASMILWVVAANPSCRFYERMGGIVVARHEEQLGDAAVPELAYGFRSIGSAV